MKIWIVAELESVFPNSGTVVGVFTDETGAQRHIVISKSIHNGLALEKMLNKPTCEWAGMHCGYTVLNTNVEAIICVWAEPAEIRGQEEFRGFRVDGKLYFFENAYSVFVEEEM